MQPAIPGLCMLAQIPPEQSRLFLQDFLVQPLLPPIMFLSSLALRTSEIPFKLIFFIPIKLKLAL